MNHVLTRSLGLFLLASSSLVTGCSLETGNGAAPKLEEVTLEKTELAVGKVETVKITIAYEDSDGDIATIHEQATSAAGTSQKPNSLTLDEAAGQTEGTHAFALQLGSSAKGTVTLSFWLKDSKGNESEKVTRTITIK